MLYMIGLGLGDAKDITVKGLEIVKRASQVYLENYTSILSCGQEELEKLYQRPVILVDRDMMEQGCKQILDDAEKGEVAVLVVGDPLNATTHTDLLVRAASRKIPYKVVHNASIVNAVASCGLQIYKFGEVVSIPFWTDTWKPESFYDKIIRNKNNGLHTLCLLDIRVKEPDLKLLIEKGIKRDEPTRFMSVAEAAHQLTEIVGKRADSKPQSQADTTVVTKLTENDVCICLARIGCDDQQIVKTTLAEAVNLKLGAPLHSLVIPGDMHPLEEDFLAMFSSL